MSETAPHGGAPEVHGACKASARTATCVDLAREALPASGGDGALFVLVACRTPGVRDVMLRFQNVCEMSKNSVPQTKIPRDEVGVSKWNSSR